ncbi:hypothetical protein ERO13_D03G049532v2 [Gossypium hirsutum]|nr:hypothetical protein ERO13_D03G049532v2 [Gossypium hirsutum]
MPIWTRSWIFFNGLLILTLRTISYGAKRLSLQGVAIGITMAVLVFIFLP